MPRADRVRTRTCLGLRRGRRQRERERLRVAPRAPTPRSPACRRARPRTGGSRRCRSSARRAGSTAGASRRRPGPTPSTRRRASCRCRRRRPVRRLEREHVGGLQAARRPIADHQRRVRARAVGEVVVVRSGLDVGPRVVEAADRDRAAADHAGRRERLARVGMTRRVEGAARSSSWSPRSARRPSRCRRRRSPGRTSRRSTACSARAVRVAVEVLVAAEVAGRDRAADRARRRVDADRRVAGFRRGPPTCARASTARPPPGT